MTYDLRLTVLFRPLSRALGHIKILGKYILHETCTEAVPSGMSHDLVQKAGLILSGGGIWYQYVKKRNLFKVDFDQ